MILARNNFWIKRGSKGPFSLMQALSNALYFTGVHHLALQQKVLDFMNENADAFWLTRRCIPHFSREEILADPNASKFDEVNLLLFGMCFDAKVKVYSIQDDILSCQPHNNKGKKLLKIFRLGENCYSVLFDKAQKPYSAFAQDLVLNLVNKALKETAAPSGQKVAGKFFNYDFHLWGFEDQTNEAVHAKLSRSINSISPSDLQSSTSKSRSFSLGFSEDKSESSDRTIQVLGLDVSKLIRPRMGPVKVDVRVSTGPMQSSSTKERFLAGITKQSNKTDVSNPAFPAPSDISEPQLIIEEAKMDEFRSLIHKENLQLNQPVAMNQVEDFLRDPHFAEHHNKSEAKNELDLGFDQLASFDFKNDNQIIKSNA